MFSDPVSPFRTIPPTPSIAKHRSGFITAAKVSPILSRALRGGKLTFIQEARAGEGAELNKRCTEYWRQVMREGGKGPQEGLSVTLLVRMWQKDVISGRINESRSRMLLIVASFSGKNFWQKMKISMTREDNIKVRVDKEGKIHTFLWSSLI